MLVKRGIGCSIYYPGPIPNYKFYKIDLNQYEALEKLYKKFKFHHIFNFAAQAGVRYSFINPRSFIKNNISINGITLKFLLLIISILVKNFLT